LGGHPLAVFRTVTLPLLWLAVLSSFLFAFLTAFDDLIISLFLSSPRGTTLAMRMSPPITPDLANFPISELSGEFNPAERLIGSTRRECLDHVVVFGHAHLRRILAAYAVYYNDARTHLALAKEAPIHPPIQRFATSPRGRSSADVAINTAGL
jgi:hypothetical protein